MVGTMSEFFKALEQAERDRALGQEAHAAGAPPAGVQAAANPAMMDAPAAATAAAEAPAPTVFRRPVLAPDLRPEARPSEEEEDEAREGIDGHMVSLVTPTTFEAEQYRTLRHMIEELHQRARLSIIACTSPTGGDGKTTTAINLAGVVRSRPPFTLSILPAGRTSANPYELLKSPRLAELMQEARRQYDYVVLDTPPLVAIPDCRAIASYVDGFLLVVAAHRTPRRLVEEALNVMEPAKVIGLVFNRDDRPLSGYDPYRSTSNGHHGRRWRQAVERARDFLPRRRTPRAR